jgi:uncharacterized protein YabE (DUF348 family)
MEVAVDRDIPVEDSIHLQVIEPIPILLNGDPVVTTAQTVGAAIRDLGIGLYAADLLDPPADTPLATGLVISFTPAAVIRAVAAMEPTDSAIVAEVSDALAERLGALAH